MIYNYILVFSVLLFLTAKIIELHLWYRTKLREVEMESAKRLLEHCLNKKETR